MFTPESNYRVFKKLVPGIMLRGMKINKVHPERLPPAGPLILICNHRSPLDALVVSSVINRYISWVVADYNLEVFWNRWLFQATGMIPVSVSGAVDKKSVKLMAAVLKSQQILGVFPEGQQYIFQGDYSQGSYQFQTGFAHMALKFQVPVLPCILKPITEKLAPLKVPDSLRKKLEQEHRVTLPKEQVTYQQVELQMGKVVTPEIFVKHNKRWLVDHCWKVMNEMWLGAGD